MDAASLVASERDAVQADDLANEARQHGRAVTQLLKRHAVELQAFVAEQVSGEYLLFQTYEASDTFTRTTLCLNSASMCGSAGSADCRAEFRTAFLRQDIETTGDWEFGPGGLRVTFSSARVITNKRVMAGEETQERSSVQRQPFHLLMDFDVVSSKDLRLLSIERADWPRRAQSLGLHPEAVAKQFGEKGAFYTRRSRKSPVFDRGPLATTPSLGS
eukprot:TRINITY_DN91574_c0_g1_i1.p1 TRINITY_DN91574_c0_g1~~TRINITY_DN91574_c0_g1_i1.p1  ORF type:complete len:217 (-),score=30.35 TRINITY_DN91574_c0_g1_i1:1026-1676(-)